MPKPKISESAGKAAVLSSLEGDKGDIATACRYLLQQTALLYPGGSVELRVPPFGAVQIIEGTDHSRGTPPNVVELDAQSFLNLACGRASFEDLKQQGKLSASGARSDLSEIFPIFEL